MCPLFDILPFIQENAESMLDLGCGTGLLLYCSFKLKKVQNAVGIDVDSNFINLLNNTFSKFNSTHYKFFSRDNYKFWPQETFNIVSMIDLLHHLKKHDQITYFKEAAKRVKSNGIFIVKDMLNRPKFYGLMNTINDLIFSRQLANYPDLDQLVSEISADFKVIFSNQTRLLWYMHRLIVLQKY
jgi:cyclopropane fatty-acyl-phospholipid synthase-like methyltransferase